MKISLQVSAMVLSGDRMLPAVLSLSSLLADDDDSFSIFECRCCCGGGAVNEILWKNKVGGRRRAAHPTPSSFPGNCSNQR